MIVSFHLEGHFETHYFLSYPVIVLVKKAFKFFIERENIDCGMREENNLINLPRGYNRHVGDEPENVSDLFMNYFIINNEATVPEQYNFVYFIIFIEAINKLSENNCTFFHSLRLFREICVSKYTVIYLLFIISTENKSLSRPLLISEK